MQRSSIVRRILDRRKPRLCADEIYDRRGGIDRLSPRGGNGIPRRKRLKLEVCELELEAEARGKDLSARSSDLDTLAAVGRPTRRAPRLQPTRTRGRSLSGTTASLKGHARFIVPRCGLLHGLRLQLEDRPPGICEVRSLQPDPGLVPWASCRAAGVLLLRVLASLALRQHELAPQSLLSRCHQSQLRRQWIAEGELLLRHRKRHAI
jgi:hypothetical protein